MLRGDKLCSGEWRRAASSDGWIDAGEDKTGRAENSCLCIDEAMDSDDALVLVEGVTHPVFDGVRKGGVIEADLVFCAAVDSKVYDSPA